jgi:enamine deaminase RidA (YjgF/YER057c/UK114 family)
MDTHIERSFSGSPFEKIAAYCRAVRAGQSISVSGTAAAAAAGGSLTEMDTYTQTMNAFAKALDAVTELGGSTETVVRTRVFLAPDASWEESSRAHHDVFEANPPANTTLYVQRLIPPGALVEIELDAVTGDAGSAA